MYCSMSFRSENTIKPIKLKYKGHLLNFPNVVYCDDSFNYQIFKSFQIRRNNE